jgi:CHASE2 domain-containing sensor protein
MDKIIILERNVMIRALPILTALFVLGAASYFAAIFTEYGSALQGITAIASLISMSLLVGASVALLILQFGLQRLRHGL